MTSSEKNKSKPIKQRLDNLLVDLGLAESRQKAQAAIMAGNILVNESPALKAGLLVSREASIRLKDQFPYVSRGALKLLHALEAFHIHPSGKVAIDIGSSTGGFTQVLLEKGASHVYAVDSGTNQLEWKLRSDPRVTTMENTNARYIDQIHFDPMPELAVMDVSFISVTKILPALLNILQKPFQIVVLIKPQFELSPDKIGAKGLVPDKYRKEAVEAVLNFAIRAGLQHSGVVESPILGAKSGNVEYLTVLKDELSAVSYTERKVFPMINK